MTEHFAQHFYTTHCYKCEFDEALLSHYTEVSFFVFLNIIYFIFS